MSKVAAVQWLWVLLIALITATKLKANEPEVFMDPKQIAERWGYPCEFHEAITADGYKLGMYRIPHGRNDQPSSNRPVVLFQHGLLSSSADWVMNLPEQSAGFMFADAGFDVWMGNFRGNTYSRSHISMPPTGNFWAFSIDEMAEYDLPALINTALSVSKAQTLFYVGHSMGTQTAFIKFSNDPGLASKVRKFYALAPVANVGHIKGPLTATAWPVGSMNALPEIMTLSDWMQNTEFSKWLASLYCQAPFMAIYCQNLMTLMLGPQSRQLNTTRIPVYFAHSPAGTSTRTMIHFSQLVTVKKLQRYDHFGIRNYKYYNQFFPPEYDISKMQTPVVLYHSDDDWLSDPEDVAYLIQKLPNIVNRYKLEGFSHIDYVWGLDAGPQLYVSMIMDMQADYDRRM